MGMEANSFSFLVIQVAIGARIALRDGRGLRCVFWYVCLLSYSRRVKGIRR